MTTAAARQTHLTDVEIDVAGEIAATAISAAGALCVFAGTVREINDGRPVSGMTYSAHRDMAESSLATLEQDLLSQHDILSCRIVHRIGMLALQEVSVLVVVRAAHRDAAFVAARSAIDQLKKTLPVWKQEHYCDGRTEWLKGSPLSELHSSAAGSNKNEETEDNR